MGAYLLVWKFVAYHFGLNKISMARTHSVNHGVNNLLIINKNRKLLFAQFQIGHEVVCLYGFVLMLLELRDGGAGTESGLMVIQFDMQFIT